MPGRRVGVQVVEEELRRTFEHRVGALGKKRAVAGKKIVFPQVRGNPDATDYVQAPARAPAGRGEAPGIAEHVAHPAAVDTIKLPGGASPRRLQRLDETKQRLAAFAKIGNFR